MKLFTFSPREILDKTVTLHVDDGDTIVSAPSWVSSPAGLTVTPGSFTDLTATARISAVGAPFGSYVVTVHAIGDSDQEYEQSVGIRVMRKIGPTFQLDPSEILDHLATLAVAVSDTVISAAWSVYSSSWVAVTAPAVTASDLNSPTAAARISGNGAAVGTYYASVLMTGSSGQQYEQSIRIHVVQR